MTTAPLAPLPAPGHPLLLAHGTLWLHRGKGDPYAAALCGFDDPYPVYERARERCAEYGGLWRSRTGAWVVADHRLAGEALAHPALSPADGGHPAVVGDEPERSRVVEICERAVEDAGTAFDLVADVAERIALDVLAESAAPSLDPARRARLAEYARSAGLALDNALCPQRLEATRRMRTAMDELRELSTEATGEADRLPAMVAGWRVTADLIAKSLAALADDPGRWDDVAEEPGRARLVVTETWRHDPPIHLQELVAGDDLELGGQEVTGGERVAILIAAANRALDASAEPAAFAPDRHIPGVPYALDRMVLKPAGAQLPPIALMDFQAETAVRAMVAGVAKARKTGLGTNGPVLARSRAPVTRGLLRYPAIAT